MAVVDGIESGQRREQSHIGLGDGVADQISLILEPLGQPVQRGEQPVEGLLVRLLGPGETASIDAVVDLGVDALSDLVDLVAQLFGI